MAYIAQPNSSQWIKVINPQTGDTRNIGHFPGGYASFSVNGDYLVVTFRDGVSKVYDCRTGYHVRNL